MNNIPKGQTPVSSLRKNLHVVLVRAENPMNIGQTARVMKNFSVFELVLVRCAPHRVSEAYTLGWKAKGLLGKAKCFRDLGEALKKSDFSVGFTTRRRVGRGALVPFMQIIPKMLEVIRSRNAHLVFGNEKNGLSNEELSKCHVVVTIPTSPAYAALNLSHAVAVALFGIFQHARGFQISKKRQRFYASAQEYEVLMKDFLQILKLLDYENPNGLLEEVHDQLKNFFWKTGLEHRELNLFRAFLYRIRDRIKSN